MARHDEEADRRFAVGLLAAKLRGANDRRALAHLVGSSDGQLWPRIARGSFSVAVELIRRLSEVTGRGADDLLAELLDKPEPPA